MLLVVFSLVTSAACGSGGKVAETSAESGSFGALEHVCGPADTPNADQTERGVTKDSIVVTTISDAGSALSPGLNQELWDASDVFAAWCNANGGIHGRKIQILEGDAQLTGYRTVIDSACQSSFALVGGGGVFDDQGQEARVKCLLPDFSAFVTTASARGSALVHQVIPLSNSQFAVGIHRLLGEKYPDSTDKIGYLSGDFAAVKLVKAQTEAAASVLGWGDPVYEQTYNVAGEKNWAPFAEQIAKSGVRGLVFSGQPSDLSRLISALDARSDSQVEWVFADANTYDQTIIDDTGAALDRIPLYLQLYMVPFEEADAGAPDAAALREYLALFDEYHPRGKSRAMLGVQSFASWLLFAKAADACGAKLTNGCIDREAKKLKAFDAGGLIAPMDLSTASPPQCFLAVTATSKGFVVKPDVKPNKGPFNCSPQNVVTLPAATFDFHEFGNPVSLDMVGRSTADLD